jgi:site-specific recombinase XerD
MYQQPKLRVEDREAGKIPAEILAGHIADFIYSRKAANRTDSTIEFYRATLVVYARYVHSWPPTVASIQAFQVHKRDSGCSKATIRAYFRSLRAFCNWLEAEGRLDDNPFAALDRPRKTRRLPRYTQPDSLKKLFAYLDRRAQEDELLAIRDLALFRLAYDTGCRGGELAAMLLDDLDLARCQVIVRDTKDGYDRVVFFGRRTAQVLGNWLDVRPSGSEVKEIFLNRSRRRPRPLTRNGIYQALQSRLEAAGIEQHVRLHDLRHSYAVHALDRGIGLNHVQKQLGHANIETTAIYAEVSAEDRRKVHLARSPADGLDDV